MKVQIVTVGGSPEPIMTSLRGNNPDHVVFIYSLTTAESQRSSEGQADGIVRDLNLPENSYSKIGALPDDLYNCYKLAADTIEEFTQKGYDVIADFTGGTKSMSAGLAIAATENDNVKISLVRGQRDDLQKIRTGHERVTTIRGMNLVYLKRNEKFIDDLIAKWNYTGALAILDDLSREGLLDDNTNLLKKLQLCRCFAAWDRFDYIRAQQHIEGIKDKAMIPFCINLSGILRTLEWHAATYRGEQMNFPGMAPVYDIMLNAQRCAGRGNYDDAVSRLYRATEMYGQFLLLERGIKSDNVDITKIPQEIKEYYEAKRNPKGEIKIGLIDNYKLLSALDKKMKEKWEKYGNPLQEKLLYRNNSFLAHGMRPIAKEDYEKFYELIEEFIDKPKVVVAQFPTEME